MSEIEFLILRALRLLLQAEMEAGEAFRDVQTKVGDETEGRIRDTDLEIAVMLSAIDRAIEKATTVSR